MKILLSKYVSEEALLASLTYDLRRDNKINYKALLVLRTCSFGTDDNNDKKVSLVLLKNKNFLLENRRLIGHDFQLSQRDCRDVICLSPLSPP